MSNKKIIKPAADKIVIILQRDWMPGTGAYDKMKSTPSSMDDTSANIMEYISY